MRDHGTVRRRLAAAAAGAVDPLPSWNDGAAKKAIVEFVTRVTTEGSPDFVPAAERIAVFDNDGTLWSEQPIYFQLAFTLDRIKALAPQHPEWKEKEPFASLLKGDLKGVLSGGEPAVFEILMAAHAGMTTEEFAKIVQDWIATARHPKTGRLYTEMVYQPMLELLAYLRECGFKTFIVSGGGIEFMRPWAEKVYGIPPEQVVGSSIKTKYELRTAGRSWSACRKWISTTTRPGSPPGFTPDRASPHHGLRQLRRRPSDAPMDGGGRRRPLPGAHPPHRRRARVGVDRASSIGRLDKALDEAQARDWTVISMKDDWKRIFPFDTIGK